MHKNNRLLIISVILVTIIAGCASPQARRATANALALDAKLQRTVVATQSFDMVVYHRGLGESGEVHVYIEGDGFAWRTRTRQSDDPTPVNPVALTLAAADPNPAVLYIARPCQYLTDEQLADCDRKYWSTYRYSETVVASVNEVLEWTQAQRPSSDRPLGVIGFSGGGTVGALVAARRTDVHWLFTIAANLDHQFWAELHGDTPLFHSLNPPNFAPALNALDQKHLVGGDDEKVPRAVADHYVRQVGLPAESVIVVNGYDHTCCWQDLWPETLCNWDPVSC